MEIKISEKDLEKTLDKIEFKRSYPELVSRLISEIQDKSGVIYEEMRSVNNIIRKHIDEIFRDNILVINSEEMDFSEPISGVDGSMVLIKGIGKKFFAMIGVSQVIFDRGLLDIENPKVNLSVSIETIEEKYDLSPKAQAVTKMMIGETKAINILINKLQKGFIFIDGPLIDPPTLADISYIKYRSEIFRNALKSEIELIGFVKRYKSALFTTKLNLKEFSYTSDQEVIPMLFSILRRSKYCGFNEIIATKPYALNPAGEYVYSENILDLYKTALNQYGVSEDIYASYLQIRYGIRPIKIEFFAKNQMDAEKKLARISNLIREISIAGTNLPLPVLLAHKTSLIRKRVAEVLFREVISRVLGYSGEDIDYQALRDMIYVFEE